MACWYEHEPYEFGGLNLSRSVYMLAIGVVRYVTSGLEGSFEEVRAKYKMGEIEKEIYLHNDAASWAS